MELPMSNRHGSYQEVVTSLPQVANLELGKCGELQPNRSFQYRLGRWLLLHFSVCAWPAKSCTFLRRISDFVVCDPYHPTLGEATYFP